MPDESTPTPETHTELHADSQPNTGKWILLILAVIYVAGSLYFLFDLQGRVAYLSKENAAAKPNQTEMIRNRANDDAKD